MAYTGATNGFAAGAQTNYSAVGYALEVNYNKAPGGDYQALRYTDVSLDVNETETQPDEINDIPEMAQSVLTGRTTQGSMSGILSAKTFDDMLAGVMGADWSTSPAIMAVSGNNLQLSFHGSDGSWLNGSDSIIFSDHNVLAKFPTSGQIFLLDPTSGACIKRSYSVIDTKTTHTLIFSAGSFAEVSPRFQNAYGSTKQFTFGPGTVVCMPSIVNDKIGKTFTFFENLSGKFKVFTGTMVNQIQITLQKGQAATVSIDLVGSDMEVADTSPAGSLTPRTSTPLINTVENFLGCSIFGNAPAGCIQSATITLSRDGSGQDTGMGHVGACGIRFGSFKAAMEITYLFRDYQQFTDWKNGKNGPVSVSVKGSDGNGYQFTLLNGIIRNPKTPISGKNQTVVATVSVTSNPVAGGGTFGIFRIGS